MYCRLQQDRSCWFLHCPNVGTAKKLTQKRERTHETFPFMTCLPILGIRHTCAVSKDRAGSAPAAASAYFTDFSWVRTILQLVTKQMGLTPRWLPIPYNRNRTPARPRSPTLLRLIQRTLQQPRAAKIVARFSLLALDRKLSRVRCLTTSPPKKPGR